jgi:TatD DNase family protein
VSKPDKWKEDHGVKGRNEPCDVKLIALVVAGIKGISVEEVAEAAWQNSLKLFYPDEA